MTLLEVKNLGVSFGGLRAVDEVDFSIKEGGLYGLIGPNGAGKTTIFNLLTGVYKPSEGTIKINNESLAGKKTFDINTLGIARTFQNIRLFHNMTVIDNIKLALDNQYKYSIFTGVFKTKKYREIENEIEKEAIKYLKVFNLENQAEILASNLSYGPQRKLEIARALATKPKLLLLDEPAAGMNPNETDDLMATIKLIRDKFDITILLIEHDMKLVAGICEELFVLNFGKKLAQGLPSKVLNDPQVITAYLGE